MSYESHALAVLYFWSVYWHHIELFHYFAKHGNNQMTKCTDCGQEMEKATSCSVFLIKLDDTIYKRDTSYFDINERCHDCGIFNIPGHIHHLGCDIERCPKCGGQLLSCNCHKKTELVVKGGHKEYRNTDLNFENTIRIYKTLEGQAEPYSIKQLANGLDLPEKEVRTSLNYLVTVNRVRKKGNGKWEAIKP